MNSISDHLYLNFQPVFSSADHAVDGFVSNPIVWPHWQSAETIAISRPILVESRGTLTLRYFILYDDPWIDGS